MTKADLANKIAKNTGIEKIIVLRIVEEMMSTIKETLLDGEDVYLRKFGSFMNKKRSKKTARNISKNTTIIIPEHYIPSFKPSKQFVEEVKNKIKTKN